MQMIKDTRGFSSSIDVLLFLVLVSVSAVLLAPAMVGNIQLMALHDTNAAEHNSQVLQSLQNGRVDDFSHAVAGTQMDFLVNETFGPGSVDSGVYQTGKKLVAGREIKHKTFANLASESVASQFTIYHAGRSVRLNLLTDEYRDNLDVQMRDYLDMQIGDRYNYNVSVVWRPFRDVPIGGETHMGPEVPDTAYVESTWIAMPYHTGFTRYYVEELISVDLDAIGANLGRANEVQEYMQEVAREEVHAVIAGEVDALASGITDKYVSNVATVDETKDEVLDYVFSRIDISRARMTLALWDKNW
ncbi:MAG: hypothetical protein K8R19_05495 [Methanosarcinales archaeon]|nr:hypothetical protein [Methanosarcinales archaeon]